MMKNKGFTLIELIVTIAIVSILALIAIPTYNEQIAKGRRSDAMRGLADLMLRQERWRSNHTSYATCAELFGSTAACASFSSTTASPYYTFTVPTNTTTGYSLTATRKSGTALASDRCGNFVLTMAAGVATKTTSTSATNCNWP